MEKFKKILTCFLATITLCFLIICVCVKIGMNIFGVEAFAAEIPNIEEPCGMSTEELEAVLKYDLKPYAKDFLIAEEEYEISATFLASLAALESGWGRFQFKKNNIFGFGRKEFESIPKCIDYVAWFLRKNYLNEEGKYYRGGTIADIGKVWCPNDEKWAEKVTGIYGGMHNG
jgi:beta-N-acetylglucosaminidase